MIIIIKTDISMDVSLRIDVNEVVYCGNGPVGKFIWMGEKEHHKCRDMSVSGGTLYLGKNVQSQRTGGHTGGKRMTEGGICEEERICPKCGKVMILCEDEKTYYQIWECDECGYKEDE